MVFQVNDPPFTGFIARCWPLKPTQWSRLTVRHSVSGFRGLAVQSIAAYVERPLGQVMVTSKQPLAGCNISSSWVYDSIWNTTWISCMYIYDYKWIYVCRFPPKRCVEDWRLGSFFIQNGQRLYCLFAHSVYILINLFTSWLIFIFGIHMFGDHSKMCQPIYSTASQPDSSMPDGPQGVIAIGAGTHLCPQGTWWFRWGHGSTKEA